MKAELRALLTGSAGVAALTGAIDWGRLPQGTTLPAVALHVIDGSDGMTQQGPDGLWQGRVQVDCYALTYAGAEALGQAVKDLLSGYRGGGFQLIQLTDERDDDDTGASDRPFLVSMDYTIGWSEQDDN